MKNVAASAHMGSWTTSPATTTTLKQQSPLQRYHAARAAVARLRTQVQGLFDKARAGGFDLAEALRIPALCQALMAARQALRELAVARALLAS